MRTQPADRIPSSCGNSPVILSIVVPLYNEQSNLHALRERLLTVEAGFELPHEVILVDDGSTDGTWQTIQTVVSSTLHWRGIRLSRNFGHQHALLAGLRLSQGRAIVTMDGDLQHPPELIPELVEAWRQGYNIVNTRRLQERRTLAPFKRLTSKYFYMIFSSLSGVEINEGSSDFRLIDRQVLTELMHFHDADIFLRGAVQWLGFSKTDIDFSVEKRHAGVSKFSTSRMLSFAIGAVISFSTKPLRLGIWVGLMTSLVAFAEILYIVIQYCLGNTVQGWASILGFVSLLFGILFLLLGVIGLYLSRIYQVLQAHPKYVVAEMISNEQTVKMS